MTHLIFFIMGYYCSRHLHFYLLTHNLVTSCDNVLTRDTFIIMKTWISGVLLCLGENVSGYPVCMNGFIFPQMD